VTVGLSSGLIARENFILAVSEEPGKEARLWGRVVDAESGPGLRFSRVRLRGTNFEVSTDRDGYFYLDRVPWGVYEVEVEQEGYGTQTQAFQIMARPQSLTVRMARHGDALDGIDFNVLRAMDFRRMRDLQHRKNLGFAQFVTRDELQVKGARTINDALTGLRGVRFVPTGMGRRVPQFLNGCVPPVWVDGVPFALDPIMGFDDPILFDVEMVEVYTSRAAIPAILKKFPDNGCAIGIWTRRGR